ncbi:MAG: hypothetical protein EPN86_02610 [Nanoarchaeota archaeon]|nr:MAG: hypothetical protein EPN86_02610 [Nanoarchaeota archaeon]
MVEQRIIVDHLRLSYEGLFNVTELYQSIDTFFREKGYDKHEKRNIEMNRPEGKYIEVELMPWKKITDYARHIIRIEMKMFNVKEVDVERNGRKVRMNSGRINIILDGYLQTDWENKWETKPMYFFIRTMFDKMLYKSYTNLYEGLLVENVNQLHVMIKSFLNLYRY